MADPKSVTADPATRDAQMKQRILTHMNKDHADSLVMYLRNYCQVPSSTASNAKLTDITTSHMIIESSWGRNMVPIDPPMKSLTESRERLATMHHTSLKALGLSDVKVDKFVLPNKLWQWTLHLVCMWMWGTLPFRSLQHPDSGSVISQVWSLGGTLPGLAKLNYTLSPIVLPGMLAIHISEMSWMIWGRLRKHQVKMGSPVWIAWVLVTFNGGVASFTRFDDLVKGMEDGKKKDGKH